MSNSETITLEFPFEHKGETYEELVVRRPKMRDLKKFEGIKDKMKKAITMLADLAEVTPDTIDEMDPTDFDKASRVIAGFLGVSEEEIQRLSDR